MPAKPRSARKNSGGGGRILVGMVLGIALAAGAYACWQHMDRIQSFFGSKPAPVPRASKSTPSSVLTKHMAQVGKSAPFSPSEDVFEAGAHTYMRQCASCHGTLRTPSPTSYQSNEPQFWLKKGIHTFDRNSSSDIYNSIAHGTPEKGMPAYAGKLSTTEIWQIALLLKSNSIELPDPVRSILARPVGK